MPSTLVLASLLLVVVACNTGVCVAIVRSGFYSRSQVFAQAALVWLLPLVGALVVALFLWSQAKAEPGKSAGEDADRWQGGEDMSTNDQHMQ
jgi:hypothetical protein